MENHFYISRSVVSLPFVCFLAGLQLSRVEILPDPHSKL